MPTQADLDKQSGRSTETSTATVRRGGTQAQLDKQSGRSTRSSRGGTQAQIDAQNAASKARQQETRRAKIHDVDTTRQDDNKEGTDERIQNDGIDRIENPLSEGSGGGGLGNDTLEVDYVDSSNTAQQATFVIVN